MSTVDRIERSAPVAPTRATLALIIAAMLALRIALLAADAVPFNGDEAIVALMARHIQQGERPAFFYGQAYLGSTDAWLVAIAFALFGQSVLAIRIVQILLFAGTLVTSYLVARRFGLDRRTAQLAVLLMALPPTTLTLYTTATLGGYGETLLLGNLLILAAPGITGQLQASRVLRAKASIVHWLAFGLLAGFAFWTFGLILVYLAPVSLWLVYRHRARAWRGYLVAAAGFLIGSAPWWTAIGQLGGSLLGELAGSAIANTVAAPTWLDSLGVRLLNFFVFGASAWFGVRYPWSPDFVLPAVAALVSVWYLGALVLAVRRGPGILWGMVGVLFITYLVTPFGGDPSGRYFVPLYLPLAIFAARGLARLRDRIGGRRGRWLAGLLIVLVLGYNLIATAQAAAQQPPGITTQFDRVTWLEPRREQALIDFLSAHGETRGYTNYWVAYPIAFLSDEQIMGVPRLPYHLDLRYTRRDDRYAPYAQAVAASPRAFYITTHHPQLDALIRQRLSGLKVSFAEATIGSYHIFYDLSRKVEPEEIGLGSPDP